MTFVHDEVERAKIRFRTLYKVDEHTGCWEWVGGADRYGYGNFRLLGKNIKAHRFAVLAFGDGIPEGYVVDHLCRNTRCVNPEHLEAVPNGINIQRGVSKYTNGAKNKAKTHCPRGHPYEGDNLIIRQIGTWTERHCLACQKIRYQESVQRRKQNEC